MADAGVLITQFNVPAAWDFCPKDTGACESTKDRRSTTMLYYRPHGSAHLTYSSGMGGVVIKPDDNLLLCSYAADGGTRGKICWNAPPPNQRGACVPGCLGQQGFNEGWCNGVGGGWCAGKPFKPSDLGKMLAFHRKDRTHYNEIIIDAYLYAWGLPSTVEAFFMLRSPACGVRCRDTARRSYQLFIKKFPAAAASTPMLALDLSNAEQPFTDAPVRSE